MDCFNYPIDVKTLRRKKASIRRTLLEQPNLIEKKIAVLGGSTTNEVVDQLELLRPQVVIERLTGDPVAEDLLSPDWILNKTTILNDIDKLMRKRNTYQGIRYEQ